MTTQPHALVEQRGHVLVVTMNRPEAKNALSGPMLAGMTAAWNQVDEDPDIRVAILTGAGGAFCAGADLKAITTSHPGDSMNSSAGAEGARSMDLSVIESLLKGRRLLKPLIAAVEGYALGGGLELALCADIIVAGESARLGLPEVKVGILPGGGGTQKLARLVGRHRAMLLIMTGRMFGAAEALTMGVVSEVAPAGQALTRALEIAHEIAAMPAISIMQIKEIINAGLNASLDTALMLERKAFQLQFATRDQKEGMRAFMEKRKPKFEGQ